METPRQDSTSFRQNTQKSKEYVRLSVTESTQSLVRKQCVKLFLKSNPQFAKYTITDDFIVDRIANYYLDNL